MSTITPRLGGAHPDHGCDARLRITRLAGARQLLRRLSLSLRADRRRGVPALRRGFFYWFPKLTGKRLSEGRAKWNFWLFFIGFNLTVL